MQKGMRTAEAAPHSTEFLSLAQCEQALALTQSEGHGKQTKAHENICHLQMSTRLHLCLTGLQLVSDTLLLCRGGRVIRDLAGILRCCAAPLFPSLAQADLRCVAIGVAVVVVDGMPYHRHVAPQLMPPA